MTALKDSGFILTVADSYLILIVIMFLQNYLCFATSFFLHVDLWNVLYCCSMCCMCNATCSTIIVQCVA